MALNTTLTAWAPRVLGVLRMMTALLYMQHGMQKLFGFPPPEDAMNPVDWFSFRGFTGELEFFGGLLFLFGLFTRPVAFILSGMMAVAYFMAHAPRNFYPILNGGDLAILFCFVFLYFFFAGGGAWSLDGLRARKKAEAAAG